MTTYLITQIYDEEMKNHTKKDFESDLDAIEFCKELVGKNPMEFDLGLTRKANQAELETKYCIGSSIGLARYDCCTQEWDELA